MSQTEMWIDEWRAPYMWTPFQLWAQERAAELSLWPYNEMGTSHLAIRNGLNPPKTISRRTIRNAIYDWRHWRELEWL